MSGVNKVIIVVAPFFISQCYNYAQPIQCDSAVVAPFFISQCYNQTLL